MEHAALHAVLLVGLILSLGGPLTAALLKSAAAAAVCFERAGRVTAVAALLAAVATLADLVVQVAEVQGSTIFGGVDLSLVIHFATETTVGRLCLARAGVLALIVAFAGRTPRRWPLIALLAPSAIVLACSVSHAAAQSQGRPLAVSAQVLHITSVAVWMGVLLQVFLMRSLLAEEPAVAGKVVQRFSPIALATTATIFASGLVLALRSLHTPAAVFGSAYGLTLLVKLTLIVPAMLAGWVNFRHIRPALARSSDALLRFHRMLELEVLAGVLVITAAGILGSISPPGEDGTLCLTQQQSRALLTPHLPTSHVDDWTAPDDPIAPTDDELRYSELTHNWSGVLVIVLGALWLAQARGGRVQLWAARLGAVALVPFGVFIAAISNPEVWLLRRVTFWQVVRDPILLEHQLGALLVFVLAWLAWRDARRPTHLRPLGYALPLVMIAGSLLLLGHAHAMVTVPDALSNLINVQHAIMGACGLFGGTLRLMQLRGLIPRRIGALAWPACVVALGIFMAFFYRELT